MVSLESTFEDKMVDALRKSNHVKYVLMKDVFDDLDKASLSNLMNSTLQIEVGTNEIKFGEGDNQIVCPNYGISITSDGEWLSSKIPDVTFDVEQSGNVRRADEAEAAYCCCVITLVLQDNVFNEELDSVIKQYNFQEMSSNKIGGLTFRDLLESWQDLQSRLVNVATSAAKFRLSSIKKDTDRFLKDGIPEDLVIELRSLDVKISVINRSFSEGVLSPINVKKLTKIEILQEINRRDMEITSIKNDSKASMLHTILSLSTEYVPATVKKRLSRLAMEQVEKLFAELPMYSEALGEKQIILQRWKRRYLKNAKYSIQKDEVIKYLNLLKEGRGNEYRIPVPQ